jgi:hypothetical protein
MEVYFELRDRLGSVRAKGVDKKKVGKSCIVWLYTYDLRDRIGCRRAKSSDKKRLTTRAWLYVWINIAKRINQTYLSDQDSASESAPPPHL